jgi:DNA-binding NarL/FixJ family response regulator
MGNPVCVSVVALDPVLEAGATSALLCCPDVTVVTRDEAAQVAVVVVDVVGPLALDAVRTTRNAVDRPEVVLVATDLTPADALSAIEAGARGLLRRREASSARLARTVLAAAGRDCTVPPDLLDRLLEHRAGVRSADTMRGDPGVPALSERERAVLSLVADGHETGEIARALSYSIRTVTSVVHDITHRYRLRNRAHAVAYALRAGLL